MTKEKNPGFRPNPNHSSCPYKAIRSEILLAALISSKHHSEQKREAPGFNPWKESQRQEDGGLTSPRQLPGGRLYAERLNYKFSSGTFMKSLAAHVAQKIFFL